MTGFNESILRHHRVIIGAQLSLIVLFLVACAFNDLIPICHYVFGCDHDLHGTA